MWDWLKSFFIRTEPVAVAPTKPAFTYQPGAITSKNPDATPVFDLDGNANTVLTNIMRRLPVRGALEPHDVPFAPGRFMPVKSVTLGVPDSLHGGMMAYAVGAEEKERVTLTLEMQETVGKYDMVSFNHVIHSVIGSIPILGKIKFAKDAPPVPLNHEDEWKKLKPLLLAQPDKFNAADIATLEGFFLREKNASAEEMDWKHIRVTHADNKVQIELDVLPLESDKTTNISGENTVIDYINQNKVDILTKMRAKVEALNVLTPEDLASLDFTAAITKGRYENTIPLIEFGSRVAGQEALGTTKLTTVDITKLQECFEAALVESSKELPSILPRIADGSMIKKAIAQRVGENPTITQALDHEMFRTWEERRAEREKEVSIVEIGNVGELANPKELKLTFELPHGVTLTKLREAIAKHANIIELNARSHFTPQKGAGQSVA